MLVLPAQLLQAGLDVGQLREFRAIQRHQAAGAHQALGHGVAGEDQVIAAAAREHLGFQGFAAIHHVVDHLDPGFGGEAAQGVFGEIIGPVVQPQGFLLGVQRRHRAAQ
ncbi:hypothetical protein D3C87_1557420 [compost metagenome]